LRHAPPFKLLTVAVLLATACAAHGQGMAQHFQDTIKVGMDAPAIKLLDTTGKEWDLAALKTKWVVLEFGACT
jgi:hypothetical protein